MSKATAPPAPDYSPITTAVSAEGAQDTSLANQQMTWAQGAYNDNLGTSNQVSDANQAVQNQDNDFATSIQNQYQQTYQPLENQFADQAANYASPDRIASEMGAAGANTAQQMDQSRTNAQQDLEGYGISPASTRFAALDVGLQAQKGAAVAGAENTARTNTINTGLGLESQAIGQGEVMPSMTAGLQNTGLQAGSGAVNNGLATTASGANTMGTAPQYLNLENGAYGIYGNTLNQSYQNQLGQFNANQNASSGLGTALGAGAALAGAYFGGPAGAAAGGKAGSALGNMFAKGGAVGDDSDSDEGPFVGHHLYAIPGHDENSHRMPIHEATARFLHTGHHIGVFASPEHANAHIKAQRQKYADGGTVDATQGGHIPIDASPSRGAVTDDIDARLNAGEFVMPKDTVAWYGQKHFQQLIEKGRKERATAPAHPTGPAPQQMQSPAPQGAVPA